MSKKPLHEVLKERRLVCDGAMGTQLMLAGLEQGGSGEHWNLTHPERVLAIQRRYAEAGADCIITNTFGGSRTMLKRHGHADELRAINQAAVRIAREAFGGREGFVLGDMGPLGAILEPYGDMPQAEALEVYRSRPAPWSKRARTPSSSKRRRRWMKSAWRLTRRRRRARRASSRRWRTIFRRTKRFT